jgi:hypothetical protein
MTVVIAESNGHHWVHAFSFVACRDCGIIRRDDDKNKPFPGVVSVGTRPHTPQERKADQ